MHLLAWCTFYGALIGKGVLIKLLKDTYSKGNNSQNGDAGAKSNHLTVYGKGG